jgi:hypothetical protein
MDGFTEPPAEYTVVDWPEFLATTGLDYFGARYFSGAQGKARR